MPHLALALVVYAGIAGTGAARVDDQVSAQMRNLGIDPIAVDDTARRTLARRGDGARDLIQGLHTDGVVVGEVVRRAAHGAVVRLIVYDGAGHLKDFLELPLDGDALVAGDLDTIRSNVRADFGDQLQVPEILPSQPASPAPRPPLPGPPPAPIVTHEQPTGPPLHLQLIVGLGVLARSFTTGPPALVAYHSGPVGAIGFDAQVEPTGPLSLSAHVDKSLAMSTRIAGVDVATSVSRWQLGAAWRFQASAAVALAPTLAVGRRSFTIESKDPTRTPDSEYTYFGAGLRLALRSGRLACLLWAAFEPVFSDSDEPTEMSYGSARRYGVDASLDVSVHLSGSIFLRAEAAVQRFWWSFPSAGERGAGGAQDTYPGAGAWIGFRY